jgi:hypothetical protein
MGFLRLGLRRYCLRIPFTIQKEKSKNLSDERISMNKRRKDSFHGKGQLKRGDKKCVLKRINTQDDRTAAL